MITQNPRKACFGSIKHPELSRIQKPYLKDFAFCPEKHSVLKTVLKLDYGFCMMYRLPKIRELRAVLLLLLIGIFGSFLSIDLVRGGEIRNISGYLTDIPPAELFTGATGYGDQLENIPIIPVLKDADIVGYTFLNTDFVSAIGYSGKPIVVIIAMGKDGIVSAARLLDHAEPIILSGIPEQKIIDFIAGYNGIDIITLAQEKGGEPPPVDIVSGATVTVMVIDDSIKRAAVRAAAALGLRGLKSRSTTPRVKKSLVPGETTIEDWQTLVGDGSFDAYILV